MKRTKLLKTLAVVLSAAGLALAAAGIVIQLVLSHGQYVGSMITDTAEFDTPRELVVITTSMPITVRYGEGDKVTLEIVGDKAKTPRIGTAPRKAKTSLFMLSSFT